MNQNAQLKHIPGSTSFSELFYFLHDELRFLEIRQKKYGDIFKTRLGFCLVIVSGREIWEILRNSPENFTTQGIFSHTGFGSIFPDSMLEKDGKKHLEERRLLAPMLGGSSLALIVPDAFRLWEQTVDALQDNQELDLPEFFERVIFTISLQLVSGLDFTAQEISETLKLFKAITTATTVPFNFGLPFGKIARGKRDKNILMQKLLLKIKKSRNETNPRGLIGALNNIKNSDGSLYEDSKIAEILAFLLWALLDTSAANAPWLFYELSKLTDWQEKLYSEQNKILTTAVPTFDDLSKLIYHDCMLYETLRLFPPAFGTMRKTTVDMTLNGVFIPRNVFLLNSIYLTNRQSSVFKDPNLFLPERWDPAAQPALSPSLLTTFGGGAHICLGRLFAQMQLKIIMMTFLQKFKLLPQPKYPVKLITTPFLTAKNAHIILKKR